MTWQDEINALANSINNGEGVCPMCAECIRFTRKICDGMNRNEVKPGQKPCKRYDLDDNVLDEIYYNFKASYMK